MEWNFTRMTIVESLQFQHYFHHNQNHWLVCLQTGNMDVYVTRQGWLLGAPLTFAHLPLPLLLIGPQTPPDFSFLRLIVPIRFPDPMSNSCLPAVGDRAVMHKEPMGDLLDESMASAVQNKFIIPAISWGKRKKNSLSNSTIGLVWIRLWARPMTEAAAQWRLSPDRISCPLLLREKHPGV